MDAISHLRAITSRHVIGRNLKIWTSRLPMGHHRAKLTQKRHPATLITVRKFRLFMTAQKFENISISRFLQKTCLLVMAVDSPPFNTCVPHSMRASYSGRFLFVWHLWTISDHEFLLFRTNMGSDSQLLISQHRTCAECAIRIDPRHQVLSVKPFPYRQMRGCSRCSSCTKALLVARKRKPPPRHPNT